MARALSIALALTSLVALALSPAAFAAPRMPLTAPRGACPGQSDLNARTQAQERAMRCMTNFARQRAGLGGLTSPPPLIASSRRKALDILRCDSFSHLACGRSFTYWMKRNGYIGGSCWRAAENIAWGTRSGTVRTIFQTWLHSPAHRRNILGPYDDLGIGLKTGRLNGRDGIRVWIQHFGSRCGR